LDRGKGGGKERGKGPRGTGRRGGSGSEASRLQSVVQFKYEEKSGGDPESGYRKGRKNAVVPLCRCVDRGDEGGSG